MIILDANAIVKLVIREEGSPKTENEVTAAIGNGDILASPDIALAEALNALWKHFSFAKDINKTELDKSTEKLLFIWDKISKIETSKLASKAIYIAAKDKLAVYDCLYIVASKVYNAPLLTFDKGIIKKAEELGIKLL